MSKSKSKTRHESASSVEDEPTVSNASSVIGQYSQSESGPQHEDETVIEEDLVEEEVEDIIGEFNGYANDNLDLFYAPFYVLLLWVFYEETVVAKLYGIKPADFAYYFIF